MLDSVLYLMVWSRKRENCNNCGTSEIPHAGHGLCFDTVGPIAKIPQIEELNIGHFLMGEAMFLGLDAAIKEMKRLIREARGG